MPLAVGLAKVALPKSLLLLVGSMLVRSLAEETSLVACPVKPAEARSQCFLQGDRAHRIVVV